MIIRTTGIPTFETLNDLWKHLTDLGYQNCRLYKPENGEQCYTGTVIVCGHEMSGCNFTQQYIVNDMKTV